MKYTVNVLYQCANQLNCISLARTHIHNPSEWVSQLFNHYTNFLCLFCDNANQHIKSARSFFFKTEFPAKSNCRLALAKLENKLRQQQQNVCAVSKRKKYSFIHSSLAIFSTARRSLSCHVYCYCYTTAYTFFSLYTQQRSQSWLWLLFMYLPACCILFNLLICNIKMQFAIFFLNCCNSIK